NRVYGHASKQCPHAVPATVTVEEHQGFVRAPEIIAKTILAPADEFSSAYDLILGRYNFTDFLRLNLLDRSFDIHTSGIAAMSQSPSQSVAERRTNARERRLWGQRLSSITIHRASIALYATCLGKERGYVSPI